MMLCTNQQIVQKDLITEVTAGPKPGPRPADSDTAGHDLETVTGWYPPLSLTWENSLNRSTWHPSPTIAGRGRISVFTSPLRDKSLKKADRTWSNVSWDGSDDASRLVHRPIVFRLRKMSCALGERAPINERKKKQKWGGRVLIRGTFWEGVG